MPVTGSYVANRDFGASHCGQVKSSLRSAKIPVVDSDGTYRYPQSAQMCVATAVRVSASASAVTCPGSAHFTGGGRRLNRLARAPFGRSSAPPTRRFSADEEDDDDARVDDIAGRETTGRTARMAPSVRMVDLDARDAIRVPRVANAPATGEANSDIANGYDCGDPRR